MTHWLIASNNNRFRLADCLSDRGFVDWKQGRYKFNKADIVFIYCSAPESSIRYMLEVTEANISAEDSFDDRAYWNDINEFNEGVNGSKYCRLRLIAESNSDALSLSPLKQNGLNIAPQTPQKVTGSLLEYVLDKFESQSLDTDFINDNIPKLKEGLKKMVYVNRYERNPFAREACVKAKGAVCAVCEFDFAKKYGRMGEGFIHIHHIVPLATIGKAYTINYETDLVPVCPNCHAMLHRKINGKVLTIEELKEIIRVQKE